MLCHEQADELGGDLDVLLDLVKLVPIDAGRRSAKAGADWVHEDQIGELQPGGFIVHQLLRRGQGRAAAGQSRALGPMPPMCSQTDESPGPPLKANRRGRRDSIADCSDCHDWNPKPAMCRPGLRFGTGIRNRFVVSFIRDEEDIGEGLTGIALDRQVSSGRPVMQRLAVHENRMLGHGRPGRGGTLRPAQAGRMCPARRTTTRAMPAM